MTFIKVQAMLSLLQAVTTPGHVFHKVDLKLPADVTGDFCVLQWKYHTGNDKGNTEEAV